MLCFNLKVKNQSISFIYFFPKNLRNICKWSMNWTKTNSLGQNKRNQLRIRTLVVLFSSVLNKAIIQISALMSRKEILFKMITCPCAKLGVNHIPKQTQHMPFFHQALQFAYLLISFFLISLQGQDIPLSYFVIMCKTYKDVETKTHKKAKKAKVQETASALNFINVEDEVFLKVRIEQFISGHKLHQIHQIDKPKVTKPTIKF